MSDLDELAHFGRRVFDDETFISVSVVSGSYIYITQGDSQITMEPATFAAIAAALRARGQS